MASGQPSAAVRTPLDHLDLLVVGSGVTGLSAAVRAVRAHRMRVGVLTKGPLDQATTRWAQGGVAAVLAGDPDSTDLHLADTLAAGDGLCDAEAVRVMVEEGPSRVEELIALGVAFDKDTEGRYLRAREGGHSRARILHAGGAATGAELERALVEAVRSEVSVLLEGWLAVELLVECGRCVGVVALSPEGRLEELRARHVLLATGGAGQLYAVTTNPPECTGDGVAMAIRAGVSVADLEFVQFHPTALWHSASPRPLLSEALRGHGAVLRDKHGRRFVDELSPRDTVARAMAATMREQETEHLWLDATGVPDLPRRFPTIAAELSSVGIDPTVDWIPVAPAAHYLCGGVLTDLDGATTLPGLWAAGEAACTGVHGANRLASNSLLEGMVFGFRVVEAIEAGFEGPRATGAMRSVLDPPSAEIPVRRLAIPDAAFLSRAGAACRTSSPGEDSHPDRLRHLQSVMSTLAGVLRNEEGLAAAAEEIRSSCGSLPPAVDRSSIESVNLHTLAACVVTAAIERRETRGCHSREDHPHRDDDLFRVRFVVGGPVG
ncbi:MAG: L-aspartate oxidase [Acidimicrobiales bacterium]|nr:MAG: L-aspartate oxidase [Acidimicrobiales bacterium]